MSEHSISSMILIFTVSHITISRPHNVLEHKRSERRETSDKITCEIDHLSILTRLCPLWIVLSLKQKRSHSFNLFTFLLYHQFHCHSLTQTEYYTINSHVMVSANCRILWEDFKMVLIINVTHFPCIQMRFFTAESHYSNAQAGVIRMHNIGYCMFF